MPRPIQFWLTSAWKLRSGRWAIWSALAALGLAVAPTSARSADFVERIAIDWHRVNSWPYPFNYVDRASVPPIFCAMIEKGWQRQNLLADYHFEGGDKKVSRQGLLKIRAILFENPPEYRVIYVERAMTNKETLARVDLVQQAAAAMLPEGDLPAVMISNMTATGRPSAEVNVEMQKWMQSIPPPRLPPPEGANGGGGATQAN